VDFRDVALVADGALLLLDAEDRSADFFAGHGDDDAGAAELVEQVAEVRVAGQVYLEALERARDGILRRVGDRADAPAVEVLEHEALEDVVDLVGLEHQLGGAVAADRAEVLEVPDAAAEQDDVADGDVGLLGRGLGRLRDRNARDCEAGERRSDRRLCDFRT